jgi:hypothetical protein
VSPAGACAYIVPFLTIVVFLAAGSHLPLPAAWLYPTRTLAVLVTLIVFSRRAVQLRPAHPAMSIALGVAIFAVWIAPDLLWPAYRGHWLFHNVLTGSGGVSPAARSSLFWVLFRAAGSALVVPVAEELFWRAWLMRRLIAPAFERVPLGAYSAEAFWVTAVLFASEHGPFWAVGLVAGIAYNWWMIRTRSLADCILAHAVTNACLAAYVLLAGRWEYWL